MRWVVQGRGWDFLRLWSWGMASSTSLQGRRALVSNSWPWDGTRDLWRFQTSSQAAGPAWARSPLQGQWCRVNLAPPGQWCWDSRAAAPGGWSVTESWGCESLAGTGTNPATIPETQSSCYQQQNWQDHRFLWEAAASGEQISFRKRCVLMWQKQSFLGFSGSCEVKRKACFRLRGEKNPPQFSATWKPWGFSCLYLAQFMSDEGKGLGWESCRISLTHPFAVPYYPSVWGCSEPRAGQVSSTKGDVQSHPQPCAPLNCWWLMHRDKISPSHCKPRKPKINVRKKCLTLKTESLIQGDLQFLLMLWSPLCLWNDMIRLPCVKSSHLLIPQRA